MVHNGNGQNEMASDTPSVLDGAMVNSVNDNQLDAPTPDEGAQLPSIIQSNEVNGAQSKRQNGSRVRANTYKN